MANIPVRVTIKITRKPRPVRRPRTQRWIGYERELAFLWETGYFT